MSFPPLSPSFFFFLSPEGKTNTGPIFSLSPSRCVRPFPPPLSPGCQTFKSRALDPPPSFHLPPPPMVFAADSSSTNDRSPLSPLFFALYYGFLFFFFFSVENGLARKFSTPQKKNPSGLEMKLETVLPFFSSLIPKTPKNPQRNSPSDRNSGRAVPPKHTPLPNLDGKTSGLSFGMQVGMTSPSLPQTTYAQWKFFPFPHVRANRPFPPRMMSSAPPPPLPLSFLCSGF